MKKIIYLFCITFIQLNATAQIEGSKLLRIETRKEVNGSFDSSFFINIKTLLPNSDINPDELLTIFYFPESNNCPSFITKVELEEAANEYKIDLEKNIPNNFIVVLTDNDLNDKKKKKIEKISNLIEKTFLKDEYHCYNRILVYKDKFIALLGDYNDEEALEGIKKMIK